MNDSLHFAHGGVPRETSTHELLDKLLDIGLGDYRPEVGTRIVTETLSWSRFPRTFHFSAIFVGGFWADLSAGRTQEQAKEFALRAQELWSNSFWRCRGLARLAMAQFWRQNRSERRERYLSSAASRWSDAQEEASGTLTPLQKLRLSFRPACIEEVDGQSLVDFLSNCSRRAADDQTFDDLWIDTLFYDTMQSLGEGLGGLLPNDKLLTVEPTFFSYDTELTFNEPVQEPSRGFLSEGSVEELISRANIDGLCALLRAQPFETWDGPSRLRFQALTRNLMTSRLFGCDLLRLCAAGAPMPERIATSVEALDWVSALAFNGWPPRAIQFLKQLCPALPMPETLPSEMAGEVLLSTTDWALEQGARVAQGDEYLVPKEAGSLDWLLFCRAENTFDAQSLARLLARGADPFCCFTLNTNHANYATVSAVGEPQASEDCAAQRLAKRCGRLHEMPPDPKVIECALALLRHAAVGPQWAKTLALFAPHQDLSAGIAQIERTLLTRSSQSLESQPQASQPSSPPESSSEAPAPLQTASPRKGRKRL